MYIIHRYNFHILKDDILLFVCMAGIDVKNKTAFAFLQDVKRRFKEKYTEEEILGAKDYDMSAGFSDVFKELIVWFLFLCRILTIRLKIKITKISSLNNSTHYYL